MQWIYWEPQNLSSSCTRIDLPQHRSPDLAGPRPVKGKLSRSFLDWYCKPAAQLATSLSNAYALRAGDRRRCSRERTLEYLVWLTPWPVFEPSGFRPPGVGCASGNATFVPVRDFSLGAPSRLRLEPCVPTAY